MKKPKSSGSSRTSPEGASPLPFIENAPKGLFVRVRLSPRASRDQADGVQNGALKIRLTAPPVEGEANRALVSFLSDLLGLPKGSFSITPGSLKSKDKKVRVEGVSERELRALFNRALG